MQRHWYSVFLLLAFVLALFPPTIVSDVVGRPVTNPTSEVTPMPDMETRTRFVCVLSAQPMFSQGRDWQTFVTLEGICLVAFVVFALKKPSP